MRLEKYEDKNKKRKKVMLISLGVIVLISISFLLYKTFASFSEEVEFSIVNGKVDYFGNSDVYFAFYKDEEQLDEMPLKGNADNLVFSYGICDNGASVIWDEELWAPVVLNLTVNKTKCSLYFNDTYQVMIGKENYYVKVTDGTLTIDKNSNNNILLCNEGVTIKEENGKLQIKNITKNTKCNYYSSSNDALNDVDDSDNYMIFLNDEINPSTWTISKDKKITIDLNGHTKYGNTINYGNLNLLSSNSLKGKFKDEKDSEEIFKNYGYSEIENVEIENMGHTIHLYESSFLRITNSKIVCEHPSWTPTAISLMDNSNAEVINTSISGPFGIILKGNNLNLLVQDSNISSTSTALQISEGIANIRVVGDCKFSASDTGYGIWSNSAATSFITLDMLNNKIPIISSENAMGIHLGYGFLNWQYGETYGKSANNIKGVQLIRKDTTQYQDNTDGKYHTYLK